MKLICRKHNAVSRVFTDGKIYDAVPAPGRAPGSTLVQVLDDFGRVRYVMPGEPSPHLVLPLIDGRQGVVGRFEVVAE